MTDLTPIATALAAPDPQEPTFQALRKLAYDLLDLKQFTMMAFDQNRGVGQRIFSDDPEPYPVGGEKPIPENTWTETVLERHQAFVGNTIEDLAAVFPDWEKIRSLGLESCLNLPIIVGGQVIGTLNCLNVAGHFTPARIAAADQLKLPGAAAFLLAAQKPVFIGAHNTAANDGG
ncbi:MAG: GAF domain-containing protein [Paracoccaceae bacterium]